MFSKDAGVNEESTSRIQALVCALGSQARWGRARSENTLEGWGHREGREKMSMSLDFPLPSSHTLEIE